MRRGWISKTIGERKTQKQETRPWMVGARGFEPLTPCASSKCSPSELSARVWQLALYMRGAACRSRWRRRADLNRRIGILQTPALPLGYAAIVPAHAAPACAPKK